MQPLPAGRRVGILTNAGGPGDHVRGCVRGRRTRGPGVECADPQALRRGLRPAASVGNPVDLLGDAAARDYGAALAAIAAG